MSDKEWLRMGLPPLVISKEDLSELVELAGEDAKLELTEAESEVPDEIGAIVSAPGVTLSLGSNARSTELAFEDEDEAVALAERLLKRLESCRRRSASLTHTDGAIFVGMLMPLGAGLFAPESARLLACGIASVFWMFFLVWAHSNSRKNWCVFRDLQ
jgi:hypothetical protein